MQTKTNTVLHGLPEKVLFCKSCVMSNQRPNSVVEFKNTGKNKLRKRRNGDINHHRNQETEKKTKK